MIVLKCKLCGGDCESHQIKSKNWEKIYHRCLNCEFIFIDREELLESSEELERYEMHNNSIDDPLYRAYFQKFIDYAFEGTPKEVKILDYGSGPEPVLASVLEENGYSVDIYDKYFSPEKKFLGKEYDVITSTEVFEHIYDPMEALKEIADHLKPGGKLVIMTHFHYNDWERFGKWWYIKDSTHIVFYNMKTMQWIGEKLGLAVEKDNNKNIVIFRKR